MDTETTMAQGLADTNARYDAACKRVLLEKYILAWIMKSCLEEYRDCNVREIAEKYIEGQPQVSAIPVLPDESGTVIHGLDTEDKSVHEGTVTYDIRFRAIVPGTEDVIALIVNVEAQNDYYPGYPILKRGIYYGSRMISSQYGREFTGSHYEKIKKVYSIWICMDPPKRKENTINRYRLVEERLVGESTEPVKDYDLLSVVMLCLGRPEGENYQGVLKMLDVLFSNETSVTDKKKILEDEYDIPMTQKLDEEVSSMCNLSEGVMRKGVAKGRAEGIAKGRAEGMAKGMAERTLSNLQSLMKNMGLSAEQAMTVLEVPEAERQQYADLLKGHPGPEKGLEQ